MTDNDIIKALECCNGDLDCCKECPAKKNNVECGDVLKNNALKLINRQKAEIYRHKAEIGRLSEYNENLRCENYGLHDDLLFGIKKAKSEAIREFAEKLKERNEDFCVDKSDMAFVVDSIVKEMVGEIK